MMMNIEHLCRICVRESHFYKHIYNEISSDDCISLMINALCDLKIRKSDGLPEFICEECCGKLLELQKFKKMCHDGETALLSLKAKYCNAVKVESEVCPTGDESDIDNLQTACQSSLSNQGLPKAVCGPSMTAEKAEIGNHAKEVDINEVYIKTEPVDCQAIPLGARSDVEEVIVPEVWCRDAPVEGTSQTSTTTSSQLPSTTGDRVVTPLQVRGKGLKVVDLETLVSKGLLRRVVKGEGGRDGNSVQGGAGEGAATSTDEMGTSSTAKQVGALTSPACGIKPAEEEKVLADGRTSSIHGRTGVKKVVAVASASGPVDIVFPKCGPNKFKPLMLTSAPFILVKSAAKPPLQPQKRKRKRNQVGGRVVKASAQSPTPAVHPPSLSPACRDKDADKLGVVSYLCTTVPSDHRPHVCETCGKCFRRELHLRTHRSTHQDERPFSCEECGKTFKLKAILNTHMIVHSPNPPQYACEHCDKVFPTRARLNYHQVTHSSEKKFECRVCRKRYKRKPHLVVHLRSHLTNDAAVACSS